MRTRATLFAFIIWAVFCPTLASAASPEKGTRQQPRFLRLEDMTVKQMERLDRSRTVVLMTLGILEEHGPDLPVSVDTIHAEAVTEQVVRTINEEKPEWTVVKFPLIPVGTRGTNVLGAKPKFMGSFTVRPAVLRDMLVDLGTMLVEQGFRDILVIYAHGNPTQSQIVNQACEFVRQSTGARMWNLNGLALVHWEEPKQAAMAGCLTSQQRQALGMDIHAGLMETSAILYLAPQLVDPDYRKLQPVPASNFGELLEQGSKSGWLGYWTYPNWASAACGRIFVTHWAKLVASFAPRALSGEDLSRVPHYPSENMPKMDEATAAKLKAASDAVSQYEAEREHKLQDWLKTQPPVQ